MPLAIVKDRIWPALGYEPNAAQERMHKARARNRVSAWGRRAGKSTSGGHELVPEAYRAFFNRRLLEDKGIRMEFWIVGPNYSDSEKEFRVFYNDCRRLKMPFDKPGTYYDQRGGDMQVSLWNGRFKVQAFSAVHPDSLVGEGLFGVIMAEAAKMKETIWTKYVRPTLADYQGWALFNSTPEGKNWFYTLWQRGNDPEDTEWWSARFPSWLNRAIYHGETKDEHVDEYLRRLKDSSGSTPATLKGLKIDPEIASLARDLTQEAFLQEIGADFSEYTGRVFKEWDEEIHVRNLGYSPSLPVYLATDYGWTNPNVGLFIQVDKWDNVYVLSEYYERGRTEQEFADDLKNGTMHPDHKWLSDKATLLFPDPEDPGASNVLARTLRLNIRPNTGGERKNRINAIRKWLKVQNLHLPLEHPERLPKLFIDRSCVNTIREMEAYRYPENKRDVTNNPEDPVKKDDHTPEALGRFFAGHFGVGVIGGGRPRSRKAAVHG